MQSLVTLVNDVIKPIPIKKPPRKLLEKDIEGAVCDYARRKGVMAEKFTSPNKRSVPDRIFLFPGGKVVFIEFKAPGKKPTEMQKRDHDKRRALGFVVMVVDDVNMGKKIVDSALGYWREL